ncbi:hypothetical protein DFP72DRAFT_839451 [Ephemerocybe angulata]|uniref:Uncharacterized protein n=1 Tax=Ephemerocybe angulata TaxID=980116 RepID=A0A8H6IHB0_9AGAR|nr:hypothetical protein DFP72DRAFT_839451 [Tulosesus angulatus]
MSAMEDVDVILMPLRMLFLQISQGGSNDWIISDEVIMLRLWNWLTHASARGPPMVPQRTWSSSQEHRPVHLQGFSPDMFLCTYADRHVCTNQVPKGKADSRICIVLSRPTDPRVDHAHPQEIFRQISYLAACSPVVLVGGAHGRQPAVCSSRATADIPLGPPGFRRHQADAPVCEAPLGYLFGLNPQTVSSKTTYTFYCNGWGQLHQPVGVTWTNRLTAGCPGSRLGWRAQILLSRLVMKDVPRTKDQTPVHITRETNLLGEKQMKGLATKYHTRLLAYIDNRSAESSYPTAIIPLNQLRHSPFTTIIIPESIHCDIRAERKVPSMAHRTQIARRDNPQQSAIGNKVKKAKHYCGDERGRSGLMIIHANASKSPQTPPHEFLRIIASLHITSLSRPG